MQLGIVGLGRTGSRIIGRLSRAGHKVIGFDPADHARAEVGARGVATVTSLAELTARLDPPRRCLLVVPPGQAVDDAVAILEQHLSAGDLILDGAHTSFRRDVAVARELAIRGINYVDVGLSGGASALEMGYCVMVGGSPEAVRLAEPLLRDLAAEGGYSHVGPTGAGHYLKMVHHGIEYALMEAYGVALGQLEAAPGYRYELEAVDEIWQHSTLPTSWSLGRSESAQHPDESRAEQERRSRVVRLHERFAEELKMGPSG